MAAKRWLLHGTGLKNLVLTIDEKRGGVPILGSPASLWSATYALSFVESLQEQGWPFSSPWHLCTCSFEHSSGLLFRFSGFWQQQFFPLMVTSSFWVFIYSSQSDLMFRSSGRSSRASPFLSLSL